MPLINGLKMACEPCIRGHRSTKCTHANERLMVPVRKPGRPLSSCPHPSSRPCTCGTVTAAIPRRQKCGCGTRAATTSSPSSSAAPTPAPAPASASASASVSASAPATTTSPSATEESLSVVTSPVDSKGTAAASRVRKTQARRGSSRKPSVDPMALERMDLNQLNIMPAFDGARNQDDASASSMHATNGAADAQYAGFPAAGNPLDGYPVMYPTFSPPMLAPPMVHPNGHTPSASNGSAPSATAGSCCGGGRAPAEQRDDMSTADSTGLDGSRAAEPKKTGSCCSSKPPAEAPAPHQQQHQQQQQQQQQQQRQQQRQQPVMVMSPFQTPIPMAHGLYPLMTPPTLFTYPPQYGTFMQPLQPEQWRQVMALLSLGQPGPQTADGFGGMAGAAAPTPGPPVASDGGHAPAGPAMYPALTQPDGNWAEGGGIATSHHCSCGDSCECVGCAAHPYNEATQNYVRSAWNSMTEATQQPQQPQQPRQHPSVDAGYTNGGGGNGNSREDSPINGQMPPPMPAAAVAHPESSGAPAQQTPQTPSDGGASATGEEQVFSSDDFFFVSYPFDDTCAGDTASCPCGDDCQCIGCVIHGK